MKMPTGRQIVSRNRQAVAAQQENAFPANTLQGDRFAGQLAGTSETLDLFRGLGSYEADHGSREATINECDMH
jgi:hypothetical protein